jgi:hypothetical protein
VVKESSNLCRRYIIAYLLRGKLVKLSRTELDEITDLIYDVNVLFPTRFKLANGIIEISSLI